MLSVSTPAKAMRLFELRVSRMDSVLAPDLLAAFLQTDYCLDDGSLVLRVGSANADLRVLYRREGVASAAFITACNPFSESLSAAENRVRQQHLADSLVQAGYHFLSGTGTHPSGTWPGEASFLVLGVARAAAIELGQRYQQNAIIWCAADAVPELVLLR